MYWNPVCRSCPDPTSWNRNERQPCLAGGILHKSSCTDPLLCCMGRPRLFLEWFGKSGPWFSPCKNHKGWNPNAPCVYPCILSVLHIKLCGGFGGVIKLNTDRDSIPYLPFMFLWLTICYAGGFTGHLFSLWQLLQLSPLRQVQDGKSSCLLLIKACLCGFSHCLQDITHHPLSHVSPGTRTCHSDTGQPLRLGSAADLHLWLASSDRHFWRKKRMISFTQMTFKLLCHREGRQALNLESCRRSTRSPLAYLQSVWEGNANAHGTVVW